MTALVVRGDARRLPLPEASVDLIVTSPPYYALRSYRDGGEHYDGQLGHEDTPAAYIAALVDCTREWMRVLKPEGSLFVNLGDKYATRYSSVRAGGRAGLNGDDGTRGRSGQNRTGVPEKSLLGLPWRYALACIDELGLVLRAEIVWDKPNPIPESATDRVHRTHEQWFHLTMAPRYYSALDVLRLPLAAPGRVAGASAFGARNASLKRTRTGAYRGPNPLGALPGSVWEIPAEPFAPPPHIDVDHHAAFPTEWPRRFVLGASPPGICVACGEGRRPVTERETVFDKARDQAHASEIAARGAAHAVMSGGTARSTLNGKTTHSITAWSCACTPYTDHEGTGEPSPTAGPDGRQGERPGDIGALHRRVGPWREYHLDGWEPPETTPAVVLDPFSGTGTVPLVASVLGRIGIGVDLSHDYCALGRWRTSDPGERAKASRVPKPPVQAQGQEPLWA